MNDCPTTEPGLSVSFNLLLKPRFGGVFAFWCQSRTSDQQPARVAGFLFLEVRHNEKNRPASFLKRVIFSFFRQKPH